MSNDTIHAHASHGTCRTVCGLPCDDLQIAYHDRTAVTCEGCKVRDTSRSNAR